jgi:hypothetical protein
MFVGFTLEPHSDLAQSPAFSARLALRIEEE